MFFFLKPEENLASQPLLLFSSYRFISHQTGEEKWPTKLEMLSVLSAEQQRLSPCPLPFLFCFSCMKLRCVEGLINDCHQSKEATAQPRMCSANGWAAWPGTGGPWNPSRGDCWTSPGRQEPLQPLMPPCSLTLCLWSVALSCHKQQAIVTSAPALHLGSSWQLLNPSWATQPSAVLGGFPRWVQMLLLPLGRKNTL